MTATTSRPSAAPAIPDPGSSARTKRTVALSFLAFCVLALVITAFKDLPETGSRLYTLNPISNLPAPPRDAPYYGTRNAIVIAVMTLIGLIGLAVAAHFSRKTRSWLPLVLTISGTAIVIPEVFVDVMGLVWYPESVNDHAYDLLGRRMGWFILAGWFGYASLTYWIYQVLESRPKTRVLWYMLGAAGLADVVLEEFILHMGMYVYYGRQPLVLISLLPWWWIPCNSLGVFLASSITYRLRAYLQGPRTLLTLLITPLSVGAVYGAIALPSFIVTNDHYPWLVTQLGGLLTIGLGLVLFAGILRYLLGRDPYDMEGYSSIDEDAEDYVPAAR